METQSDQNIRVVSLSNLRVMCERASGVMCHQFKVTLVSRSRVHVEYSNENEYARAEPMTAVFAAIPGWMDHDDKENPQVVLQILRVIHDNCDGEGWQAFQPLLGCPTLWRDPKSDSWYSHADFERDGGSPIETGLPDNCTVCDLPVAYEAHCNACGWKDRYSAKQWTGYQDAKSHALASHGVCNTLYGERPNKPDIIVRTITRAEVQS